MARPIPLDAPVTRMLLPTWSAFEESMKSYVSLWMVFVNTDPAKKLRHSEGWKVGETNLLIFGFVMQPLSDRTLHLQPWPSSLRSQYMETQPGLVRFPM